MLMCQIQQHCNTCDHHMMKRWKHNFMALNGNLWCRKYYLTPTLVLYLVIPVIIVLQVAFVGQRGQEFSGDIALDDLLLLTHKCPRWHSTNAQPTLNQGGKQHSIHKPRPHTYIFEPHTQSDNIEAEILLLQIPWWLLIREQYWIGSIKFLYVEQFVKLVKAHNYWKHILAMS